MLKGEDLSLKGEDLSFRVQGFLLVRGQSLRSGAQCLGLSVIIRSRGLRLLDSGFRASTAEGEVGTGWGNMKSKLLMARTC